MKEGGGGFYLWVKAILGTGTPYIQWVDDSEAMVNYLKGAFMQHQFHYPKKGLPKFSAIFGEGWL
jgi:hypothetical protein